VEKLRASLAKHVPDIIAALVASAKEGDTAAAKLILERVIPAVKSEELPVTLRCHRRDWPSRAVPFL
jgi:hypothetical protein